MSMILKSYGEGLEPFFALDSTTWQYGSTTNCTLTVTIGSEDGTPYTGIVNLSYSSGISGPSSVDCVNGSCSIPIQRTATGNATLTVTVPDGSGVSGKSESFTGNTAGQSVYIDGVTAWYEWFYGYTDDEGGCAAGFMSSSMRIVVNGTNIFWDTGHTGQNPTNGYYRGDLISHEGKSFSNGCTQTDIYGVILHE